MRKWAALSLFLCVVCSAQVSRRAPWFKGAAVGSSVIQPDLYAVAYRWIAFNAFTNGVVTNWFDSIQSLPFSNGNNAARPTNSLPAWGGTWYPTNGVYTDFTHWLTNPPLTLSSNFALGFIFNVADFGVNNAVLWGDINNYETLLWHVSMPSQPYAFGDSRISSLTPMTSQYFGQLTNRMVDMIISVSGSSFSATATNYCYTNGVLSSITSDDLTSMITNPPTFFGRNPITGNAPKMSVAEVWVWTNGNATPIDLPSSNRNNFHRYATNTYNYGPP